MKKVLHISKYYFPFSGGTEQIARDTVIALKDNYNQKVIAFNDGKTDKIDYVDGVEIIKCGCFSKIASQSFSKTYKHKLHKVMEEYRPDIIVFHYPNPFAAGLLLHELRLSKKNLKLVVYWHLDIIRQKYLKLFFIPQNIKLLSRADKVIATSPNYIEGSGWLKFVKEKCIVIPNCINVQRMTITPEIKEKAAEIRKVNKDKIICVAVGRHTKYKGFTYLIQASQLLDNNFHIYITGTGELTEKLHKEASGDKKVTFTGRIDDSELKALILASDIFCFPSITKNEAFGLALAEGMYYEKPTVTFTIPGSGVNYVSLNRITGIEVENRNVKEYANALRELAENESLRKQYGRAGKSRVEEYFLNAQFSECIQNLLTDL